MKMFCLLFNRSKAALKSLQKILNKYSFLYGRVQVFHIFKQFTMHVNLKYIVSSFVILHVISVMKPKFIRFFLFVHSVAQARA